MNQTIKVAVTSAALTPELHRVITDVDPGVELLDARDLLPPPRFAGDHEGDPAFRRTATQQSAFEALLSQADVLYGIPDGAPRKLAEVVRRSPRLRWVHTMAAGGGAQIRQAELTREELDRVTFTTSAGVHASTLAEFALFGVLAGSKDLARLQDLQRTKTWPLRWAMRQVRDQTVLVVGLGAIGREVARLLTSIGATVVGVKRRAGSVDFVEEVHPVEALPQLVARADAIVLALPGTVSTERLFGSRLIGAAKPGTVVVNIGRGTVVDEDALVDALRSGRISSAFLDVFAVEPLPAESPLWTMPQVVISPHTAALSPLEQRRIAELFADNLGRWLTGKEMRNVVDTHEFY